ncbi:MULTISPECIES: hypothetical protein [Clostridium]|nr:MULTISPECIES: hypothetical protein [Clostridium]EKS4345770.1 hypothetical protein [Clostridium botulinum]EKS4396683.1 hypothetical protein [Clostridium botulinum]MBO0530370.1 hypothetical protein [Clostridium botulinum]MBO0538448.1 hypothetical protein [Clostridium botulinum]MBO0554883.1 hypothetical protein [Clostridium botulinum]
MIESIGKLIALAISLLTIRQLSLQNSKTELEIKKLRLEIKRLKEGD